MTFSIGEPKPSCQIGQKHDECWSINRNRWRQELEPNLEESLTTIENISTNNGGVTVAYHREIKQFSKVAALDYRKNQPNVAES